MAKYRTGEVWERMGLRPTTCAACGRAFERRAEHAWHLTNGHGKTQWYCSYSCMRKDEKPRLEAARAKADRLIAAAKPMTRADQLQRRVTTCRARYEQALAKRQDAKAWSAMTRRERKNACDSVSHWLARLTVAEQELADAKKEEGGEGDASEPFLRNRRA